MEDVNLTSDVNSLLQSLGFNPSAADTFDRYVLILALMLVSAIVFVIVKYVILRLIARVVERTETKLDDMLLSPAVMDSIAMLVPVALFGWMVPLAFESSDMRQALIVRVVNILIICTTARLFNNVFKSMDEVFNEMQRFKGHVLSAIFQVLRVIVFCIAGIIIVAIILGKSPSSLVAGLGASAAILMLVFKDTIVGFVSGVQLSANKMLKVGDWITVPKANANGVVTAVSLITVKVRNYDNTIVTIPPYTLVSDSFQNWRFMQESGGRRLMRSVNIDVSTICFCTPEMLQRFRKIPLMDKYLDSLPVGKEAGAPDINRPTNLGLFRAYLGLYLESLPDINKELLYMIRQLQPADSGLPLEIYFFTHQKEWKRFEEVSCYVLEHIYAIVHEFDLRIYQKPSSYDMQLLSRVLNAKEC